MKVIRRCATAGLILAASYGPLAAADVPLILLSKDLARTGKLDSSLCHDSISNLSDAEQHRHAV